MSGLTPDGFITETFETLRAKIVSALRIKFGPIPLDSSTIEGQTIDIFVEALVKLWEAAEASFSALDIDKAIGVALDALCALTGTFRRAATFTAGDSVILTGDDAATIAAGVVLSPGPGKTQVKTLIDATLVAANPWQAVHGYAVGDIVANLGNIYIVASGDTSGAGPGPTLTSRDGTPFLDGNIVWTWLGAGVAFEKDVQVRALVAGPLGVPTYAIASIETPVPGLGGATNLADLNIGSASMKDAELRALQSFEVSAPGTGTKPAIKAGLLEISGVVSTTVFTNVSNVVDSDGVPPHDVEAVVRGGADQDIFDFLVDNVDAGIGTHGNTSGMSVDADGFVQALAFSRPVEVTIYVAVTLVKDPKTYAGDAAVKQAIVAFGQKQDVGRDAVSSQLIGAIWRGVEDVVAGVAGVLDVSSVFIKTTPGPTLPNTIVITSRQLATYDTTRITVSTSDGVP